MGFTVFPQSRGAWIRAGVLALSPLWLGGSLLLWMIPMPGESHRGAPGPLAVPDADLPGRLRAHVHQLALVIGPRSEWQRPALDAAAAYVRGHLESAGYEVTPQPFAGELGTVYNLVAERRGTAPQAALVVVGAHYDTVSETPGADDNASGVAVMLELARTLANDTPARTIRFVAFVNEEPPHFQNETMGSTAAAKASETAGEEIAAMLSLETVSYFKDAPGTQTYPPPFDWFYPDRGDFLTFVGDLGSRSLVRRCVETFRGAALLPSEGVAAPSFLPGIGWSDQWSYWKSGYPGVMVTDTAPFRNPGYHLKSDVPARLDYERMAWVAVGVRAVVRELARE